MTKTKQLDVLRARLTSRAKELGTTVWRQLKNCHQVMLTSATTAHECDLYHTNMFLRMYINGNETQTAFDPYYPLRMYNQSTLDGIIIWSLELFGGETDVYQRPVPDDWLHRMGVEERKNDIQIVHLHACVASDDPIEIYQTMFPVLNGPDVIAKLRAEGIHVGYTAAKSLDLTLPLDCG